MEVGRRILSLAVVFLAISLHAQNLVLNGSFEDGGGSFTNWDISFTSGGSYYGPWIGNGGVDGSYYAQFLFEPADGDDVISQTVPTIPGVTYEVSFDAEDGGGHNFGAWCSFGGFLTNIMQPFETTNGGIIYGWMRFDFTITATSAQTDLQFVIGADMGSEFGLDAISVTAAPPERTMNVSFCRDPGGAVHCLWKGFPGTNYCIQVSSDLVTWTSLTNLTATNGTGLFGMVDTPPTDCPQRFYRVVCP